MTETDVRASLRNATGDERDHVTIPLEFLITEWDRIDVIGWRDPKIPARGYLFTELDGAPAGIVLRAASAPMSRHRAAMCSLCHTQQPADQVSLFSARRTGEAGEHGDTVGTYICSDLSCHENIGLPAPLAPSEVRPGGLAAERAERFAGRVRAFVAGVIGP